MPELDVVYRPPSPSRLRKSLAHLHPCLCSCQRGETVSELQLPAGLLFIPQLIYESGEPWLNDIDGGNWRTLRKTCPRATLSTTNLTWTDPGANTCLCGERLVTNHISHGMAYPHPKLKLFWFVFWAANSELRISAGVLECLSIYCGLNLCLMIWT
jgi:hypothetical protein